jgi:hypothetical protein
VFAIASLLVVLVLSLLVTRIATVALTHTGLSREVARFQARSAFSGVGFTTSEAERVVQHPVRRRILMLLMLFGNAGIVTAVASLMLTFISTGESGRWMPLVFLGAGLAVLWTVASSNWVDRRLSQLITAALKRWTDLDVRDYAHLLQLAGDYGVVEMQVESEDWLADKTLAEANLSQEGVLVLGIQRADGSYTGAPTGRTVIYPADTLILYGQSSALADLDSRRAGIGGTLAHQEAVARQEEGVLGPEDVDHPPEYEEEITPKTDTASGRS